MRFHKAVRISRVEADFIISHPAESGGECIVVEHYGEWYDTREMTDAEVDRFIRDLVRATHSEITSGRLTPH